MSSTYNRDLQKLLKQMRDLRRRVAQREQSDMTRFRENNSNTTSSAVRDARSAHSRISKAEEDSRVRMTDPSRAAAGTGQYGPKVPKGRLRGPNGRLVAPSQTRDTEFAGPARDAAKADKPKKADAQAPAPPAPRLPAPTSGRGGSRTAPRKTPSKPNYSQQAATADVRPSRKKDKGVPLRSDFSDIGGRLGAALGGAQDAILSERDIKKIKNGMNYGSEDTNDYKVKSPDYSAKAAAAKRLMQKKKKKED